MDASILILYVEDDFLVALPVVELLEHSGFQVEHIANGAKAVERLDIEPHPAALVTDIRLPALDGWDVARRAREHFPTIPVVYASGDSAGEWSAKSVPESIMLQKPFAEAQLIAAVTSLLNNRPISSGWRQPGGSSRLLVLSEWNFAFRNGPQDAGNVTCTIVPLLDLISIWPLSCRANALSSRLPIPVVTPS